MQKSGEKRQRDEDSAVREMIESPRKRVKTETQTLAVVIPPPQQGDSEFTPPQQEVKFITPQQEDKVNTPPPQEDNFTPPQQEGKTCGCCKRSNIGVYKQCEQCNFIWCGFCFGVAECLCDRPQQ